MNIDVWSLFLHTIISVHNRGMFHWEDPQSEDIKVQVPQVDAFHGAFCCRQKRGKPKYIQIPQEANPNHRTKNGPTFNSETIRKHLLSFHLNIAISCHIHHFQSFFIPNRSRLRTNLQCSCTSAASPPCLGLPQETTRPSCRRAAKARWLQQMSRTLISCSWTQVVTKNNQNVQKWKTFKTETFEKKKTTAKISQTHITNRSYFEPHFWVLFWLQKKVAWTSEASPPAYQGPQANTEPSPFKAAKAKEEQNTCCTSVSWSWHYGPRTFLPKKGLPNSERKVTYPVVYNMNEYVGISIFSNGSYLCSWRCFKKSTTISTSEHNKTGAQ